MTLVSIVVPMYNAERTVKQCMRSLLKQNYPNLEIIVVDDGSKDKSPGFCDEFAQENTNVTVIHQDNRGSVEARRTGLSRCKGEYVCFCDADDTMPSNAISLMMENMGSADLCIGKGIRLINSFKLKPRYSPHAFVFRHQNDIHGKSFSKNYIVVGLEYLMSQLSYGRSCIEQRYLSEYTSRHPM